MLVFFLQQLSGKKSQVWNRILKNQLLKWYLGYNVFFGPVTNINKNKHEPMKNLSSVKIIFDI